MATTSPTRIDDEVFASAKIIGPLLSRSASQQIAHWARIGRALESSDKVSLSMVTQALEGRRDYDQLNDEEQALVRAEWEVRLKDRLAELNYAEDFAAQGRAYVELDDEGNVVRREPGSA